MANKSDVCVHGLGRIGLPTASVLANSGYSVRGYDTDEGTRAALRNHEFILEEADLERFVEEALNDGFQVVDRPVEADFHLVCVPTPYDSGDDKCDISYIEAAGKSVSRLLREGDTVVLESTVPPGTSAGRFRDVLESSGLSATTDFLLGYSPETVLPGNTLRELQLNDRIVGTVAGRSPDPIVELYGSFVSGHIETTDSTTAEFVKLVQNAFRDVNIAFANEVAQIAHDYGVDSSEAISSANNHPRVDILHPGPGVGGHCLPIDPRFLRQGSVRTTLIDAARSVNDGMATFVRELLSSDFDDLSETVVALLGVAYKGGVSDTRMSPALLIADELRSAGVKEVRLTDPYVEDEDFEAPVVSLAEGIEHVDAAIVVTDHPEYSALDPNQFATRMRGRTIVDTRSLIDRARWGAAGFNVYSV